MFEFEKTASANSLDRRRIKSNYDPLSDFYGEIKSFDGSRKGMRNNSIHKRQEEDLFDLMKPSNKPGLRMLEDKLQKQNKVIQRMFNGMKETKSSQQEKLDNLYVSNEDRTPQRRTRTHHLDKFNQINRLKSQLEGFNQVPSGQNFNQQQFDDRYPTKLDGHYPPNPYQAVQNQFYNPYGPPPLHPLPAMNPYQNPPYPPYPQYPPQPPYQPMNYPPQQWQQPQTLQNPNHQQQPQQVIQQPWLNPVQTIPMQPPQAQQSQSVQQYQNVQSIEQQLQQPTQQLPQIQQVQPAQFPQQLAPFQQFQQPQFGYPFYINISQTLPVQQPQPIIPQSQQIAIQQKPQTPNSPEQKMRRSLDSTQKNKKSHSLREHKIRQQRDESVDQSLDEYSSKTSIKTINENKIINEIRTIDEIPQKEQVKTVLTEKQKRMLKRKLRVRALVVHFAVKFPKYVVWATNKEKKDFLDAQIKIEPIILEEIKKWRTEFNKHFLSKARVELWQPDFAYVENAKVTLANADQYAINLMQITKFFLESLKLSSSALTDQHMYYLVAFSCPGQIFRDNFHSEFVTVRLNPNTYDRLSHQNSDVQTRMIIAEYFIMHIMLTHFVSTQNWFPNILKINKGAQKVKTICSLIQDLFYEAFKELSIKENPSKFKHANKTLSLDFDVKDWTKIATVVETQPGSTLENNVFGLYKKEELYAKLQEKSASMTLRKHLQNLLKEWIDSMFSRVNALYQKGKQERSSNMIADLKKIYSGTQLEKQVTEQQENIK